jgi:hypothetical protein
MALKPKTIETLSVPPLQTGSLMMRIVGLTPLVQNRMAAKAKQELLVGGQRKGKADRVKLKHDPLKEYREAAHMMRTGPTALGLPVTAVKAAMCTAALETPGVTKTAAQRLLFMPGELTAVYGTPQLRMDVVRSADINRTPDIRTRPFLPKWAAEIEIRFVVPQLSALSVSTLLANAGIMIGVGDGRQEKGKLNWGCFRILGDGEDDPEWDDLVANHGRNAQENALADPEYAEGDTADLMKFFFEEVKRRAA